MPEGAYARVGDAVIGPDLIDGAQARLDAYGQARFRGPEGRRALLEAVIQEELLVQEARDAGLHRDPRVEWAVYEELAELQRAATLERRLPRAEVAADTEALRARYDATREDFRLPERRSMRSIPYRTFDEAEAAIARLQAGEVDLVALAQEEGADVLRTKMMRRNDDDFPGFHELLFADDLEQGDPLAHPVLSGDLVLVGVLAEVQLASYRPFEDAEVQEQLVGAELEARRAPIEAGLAAELAEQFPAR